MKFESHELAFLIGIILLCFSIAVYVKGYLETKGWEYLYFIALFIVLILGAIYMLLRKEEEEDFGLLRDF